MKKLLLTLGLASLTLASGNAQGTINPLNGVLTRVRYDSNSNGLYDLDDRNATMSDGLQIGLFWGEAGGPANTLAGVLTIGPVDGVLVGLPAIFSVDGWGDVGAVISLRFCALAGGGLDTGTKQVMLAPAAGPGTVLWGSTATASRFGAPLMNLGTPTCVPEPGTLALGALGGLALLLRWRKSSRK